MASARSGRLLKEMKMLEQSPSEGISCWVSESNESQHPGAARLDRLEAAIMGPRDSPYQDGIFRLSITIGARYPFEPPQCRFLTPVYHPNVDSSGRICLDLLKMPPAGAWKPSVNISTLLKSLQLLLANPNPDDGLMADISAQYVSNRQLFELKASEHTKKHAMQPQTAAKTKSDRPSDSGQPAAKLSKTT